MYEKLNPFIRVARYQDIFPGSSVKRRVIFDYELLYVKAGKATITIESEQYTAKPGDVFIFRPRQPHSVIVPDKQILSQPHIHFDLEYFPDAHEVPISFKPEENISEADKRYFRPDILPMFFKPFPSRVRLKSPELFENLLRNVIYAHEDRSPFHELNKKAAFLLLFQQLLQEISASRNPSQDEKTSCAEKVKRFIESNTDVALSVEDIANSVGYSKSYIQSVFNELYHTSPIKYHRALRVNRSKYLLRTSSANITEIADRLGFGSIHDFSRSFKKIEGISPQQFRAALQKNMEQQVNTMHDTPIHLLLFDLFYTLADPFEALKTEESAAFGLTPAQFDAFLANNPLNIERGLGLVKTDNDLIERFCELLPFQPTLAQKQRFREARYARLRKSLTEISPIILDTLRKLRNKGFRLGLISNADVFDIAFWNESPLSALFDDVIFSCSAGVLKPDCRIYEMALQEMKAAPEEAMFIGDGANNELYGAKLAGLTTVWSEQLIRYNEKKREQISHDADYRIDRLDELLTLLDPKNENGVSLKK